MKTIFLTSILSIFFYLHIFWHSKSNLDTIQNDCLISIESDNPSMPITLGEDNFLRIVTSCPFFEISSIKWEPSDFLDCSDCLLVNAIPFEDICYEVIVNWLDGCVSTEEICLTLKNCEAEFNENNIRGLAPANISSDATITLEIAQTQFVRITASQSKSGEKDIWKGWIEEGLRTVDLDLSTLSQGEYNLDVCLYPENKSISFTKL